MKLRCLVAAVVVLSSSTRAQAQEAAGAPEAPVEWVLRAPAPIDLRMNGAPRASSVATSAPLVPWFGAKPSPVKLSNGAITAIIIGGIVLVVLVVAGVAVIGKPGKVK